MTRALALASALLLAGASLAGAEAKRGAPAPDFAVSRLSGGSLRLSELRGQVVIVDFWASWCEPCQRELPALMQLQEELAKQGVQIITINLDKQRDNVAAMVKRLKLTLPVGLDPSGSVAEAYDLPKMPTSYVIDRGGMVRAVHEGFDGAADIARMRKELQALIAAK